MPPKLLKLSIDQESKLIEIVKTKPVLFDKRLDGYRKCHDGIWDEIALELGIEDLSGTEWDKQWKKLRGQYLAYRRKLKKPSGSGTSRRPYFRHEQSMQFLNDSLGDEETFSNVPDVDEQVRDLEQPDPENGNETVVDMDERSHRSHTKFNGKRKADSFEEELLTILKKENEDEFENFGKVVAAKLRKIASEDKREAAKLQHAINNEIFKYELETVT